MPAVIVKRSLGRLVTTAASPQLRLLPTPTRTLRNGKNTRTAFITAVVPTRCTCCPSLPNCPAGLLTVKAKPLRGGLRPALTAPTPRGVGSYARNREESGQHLKKPVFKPALRSSRSIVYSR